MEREQAIDYLSRTDPRFALTEDTIRGVRYRIFVNAPHDLREFLDRCADTHRQAEALVYGEERWTYTDLHRQVRRSADVLVHQLHVRPGEPVALALRNYPELVILILAIAAVSAVAVPLNAWWSGEELRYAINDSGAHWVFADAPRLALVRPFHVQDRLELVAVRCQDAPLNYAKLLRDNPQETWPAVHLRPDDDFAIIYSSGSTGTPKGVVLTHRGAISCVYSRLFAIELASLVTQPPPPPMPERPGMLIVTPLFHVTALQACCLVGMANGAKIVLMYRWDPDEAVRIVNAENINYISGVPTQSTELLEAARRARTSLPSLRALGAGGDKRPAAQVGVLAHGLPQTMIGTGWGMTETNSLGLTLTGPEYVAHPEAAGRPTPPVQDFRIVDEQDKPVALGAVGELTVKSPANMRCYLHREKDTAGAVHDGWLHTGDLARVDEQGLFYIVGRKKNIIIRGGENISVLEVEGALYRHPDIVEAAVFDIPDERLGQTVGAAIRVKPDCHVTELSVKQFLATHLAHFKIPERVFIMDETLPRTGTEKLDRRALRAQCLGRAAI